MVKGIRKLDPQLPVLIVAGLLVLVLSLAMSGASLAAIGDLVKVGRPTPRLQTRVAVISPSELPYKTYLAAVVKSAVVKSQGSHVPEGWKGVGDPQQAGTNKDLSLLNISWFYDWGWDVANHMSDPKFVPMVWSNADVGSLEQAARDYPGRYWMIFNEPDMQEQANIPPAEAASYYDAFYQAIKEADPTAKVGGINLTYLDENGHTNGPYYSDYLPIFLAHVSSPIEFYCIHDWGGGRGPFVDGKPTWEVLEKHINYIRGFEQLKDVSIWLTETGGTGDLYSDENSIEIRDNYMKPMLEWLDTKGFDLGITRVAWFSTLCGNNPNYGESPWRSDSLYKDTTWEASPLGDYWSCVAEGC